MDDKNERAVVQLIKDGFNRLIFIGFAKAILLALILAAILSGCDYPQPRTGFVTRPIATISGIYKADDLYSNPQVGWAYTEGVTEQ